MKKLLLSSFALLITFQLFAQEPLKVGDKAPLFNLKDNAGKAIDLKKILKENKSKLDSLKIPSNIELIDVNEY